MPRLPGSAVLPAEVPGTHIQRVPKEQRREERQEGGAAEPPAGSQPGVWCG